MRISLGKRKLKPSSLVSQMESQRPSEGEDEVIWILPELEGHIAEAVLEMRISGRESGTDSIWYVVFSPPNESSKITRVERLENVFSLPSTEPSTLNVLHQCPDSEKKWARQEMEKPKPKPAEPELKPAPKPAEPPKPKPPPPPPKPKPPPPLPPASEGFPFGLADMNLMQQQFPFGLADMNLMQQQKHPLSRFDRVSRLKQKLEEQKHGPNKNFNLLTDAYRSMNANTDVHFDDAFFNQRTPLGNTVLHLAASYGNHAMVEEVTERVPQLFTVVNNNYDTALHFAARTGHGSTIKLLLNKFLLFVRDKTRDHDHLPNLEMMLMVSLTLFRNKQGNTFLHDAFMTSSHNGAAIFEAFEAPFIENDRPGFDEASFKRIVHRLAPFAANVEGKSLLYYAVDVNCKQVVDQLMEFCIEGQLKPRGKSPLLPTLINKHIDMLGTILSKKRGWIHLRNERGWFPLHQAVLLGYLQGVLYLVWKCPSCTMERDNEGYLPIHLACIDGRVQIVHELLKYCPDPVEMVTDSSGQNLLHLACAFGNYDLVKYLLEDPKLEIMINQKDIKGNTPLHLATTFCRPKIVHALTWDIRVDLSLLNHYNLTALDIAEAIQGTSVSLSQRLTWSTLQSARAPRSSVTSYSHVGTRSTCPHCGFTNPYHSCTNICPRCGFPDPYPTRATEYKDRIDTLIVVSTLIITTSFAAGFTIPGDVDQGIPILLHRLAFHLFILSHTISVFGAISATIILMWARLEDLNLAVFALAWAIPLLGLSLTSLSLAFLAGMYLLVSKLSWLAATFLVIGVVLILLVVFLYLLLLLPSTSSSPFLRYISYYPFLFFANIAEWKVDANKMGSKAIIPVL